MDSWVIQMIIGGGVAVIAYFLKQKDDAQGKQISALWEKHDQDAKQLRDLELRIAQEHYVKRELDEKFDRMESTFRDGFKDLGEKFDKLSGAMIEHFSKAK